MPHALGLVCQGPGYLAHGVEGAGTLRSSVGVIGPDVTELQEKLAPLQRQESWKNRQLRTFDELRKRSTGAGTVVLDAKVSSAPVLHLAF